MALGVLMGLSVPQNGKIPWFIQEDVIAQYCSRSGIITMYWGLSKMGILQLIVNLPPFLHLFRPSVASGLNVKKLMHLLTSYNAFLTCTCRYIREVYAGRRVAGSTTITLGILLVALMRSQSLALKGLLRFNLFNL